MATNTKKDKFYSVLKNIFIGAKIEGNSGYVNLMRIKNKYYQDFKGQLATDIDKKLDEVGRNFEEELYNKLYTFFKKYFSESGSIYFAYTPLQEKIYEKIYRDDKDVMLFWKTNMLYYVKTERLYQDMDFQDEDSLIWYHFDVSELEHKQNNEKKELIFEYDKSWFEDNKREIFFKVKYSKNGTKTKIDDILKKIKRSARAFASYKEQELKRALGIFRKQSEVDYFINKNAKEFLREQFSLWIKTYVFDDDSIFEEARLKQLKALRDIAYNIIDLVAQFEDELVKIWNKPKFAHSSNYVITLDKIAEKDPDLLKKLLKHKKIGKQIKEWQELGIIDDNFNVNDIFKVEKDGELQFEEKKKPILNQKWQYLPLDTKYFKEFEYDILALFDDLDNQLDGWLIHSENYQALNTLKNKFFQKIDLIYIDPPFNTGDDFDYIDNYQDSSWLTIMEDRLHLSNALLKPNGNFYLHLDENANYLGRYVSDKVFGKEFFKREIVWDIQVLSGYKVKGADYNWILGHQNILYYAKNTKQIFNKVMQEHTLKYLDSFNKTDENGDLYQVAHGRRIYKKDVVDKGKPFGDVWKLLQDLIDIQRPFPEVWEEITQFIDDNSSFKDVWDDIKSFQQQPTSNERINFDTQKPEKLLERIIKSSSDDNGIIMDFYSGSGTTVCTALKIPFRKFIGVEMDEHFNTIILPRIKKDLFDGRRTVVAIDNNYYGGGFFKYYKLEQYEETLRKAKYEDKGALPKDIYHQYIFFKDLKLADEVVKLDDKSRNIKIDLTKLHDKIDIPETLSFLTGKFIKQIFKDKVVFTDGSEIEYANIDYKIVKPLIWW